MSNIRRWEWARRECHRVRCQDDQRLPGYGDCVALEKGVQHKDSWGTDKLFNPRDWDCGLTLLIDT